MRKYALLIMLALVLAACGGGDDGGGSSEQGPSATPFVASPLPPTWTPTPPGFAASDTPSPEPGEVEATVELQSGALTGGTPLPPTWTPGRQPTITPRYTASPVPPTLVPAATFTSQPEYCYALTAITGDLRLRVGESTIVRWTPVQGVTSYYVDVRHPGGGIVLEATVNETMFEVPAETFTVAGAYGWEVWPLDAAGLRICFSTSGEIIVSF